jgi:hypothetical protein
MSDDGSLDDDEFFDDDDDDDDDTVGGELGPDPEAELDSDELMAEVERFLRDQGSDDT